MTDAAHSITTGGQRLHLANCDREPIHTPPAIQPHGVLLTFSEPDLVLRQASRNAADGFGRPVEDLLGARLEDLFDAASTTTLRRLLAADDARVLPAPTVETTTADGATQLQVRLHRSGGLIVCEVEPRDAAGGVNPTDFVRDVSQAMAGLYGATGVRAMSQRAAEEVKRLTGYDRVMVHRFDADGHGEVIAEAREQRLDSVLGQRCPPTDVLVHARTPYPRQTIRLIVDVDHEPSPIWPPDNPLTGEPLDLGLAWLRSVSPIHRERLRSMGVTGTLVISLTREGELWGLIACHHDSSHYVPESVRSACQFIGELLSFQFAREEEADLQRERAALRFTRGKLLGLIRSSPTLSAGLHAGTDLLLSLCEADGVSVMLGGERITAGVVADEAVERAIVEHLPSRGTLRTDRLPVERPELAGETDLCGALALPLPRGVGRHIVWYRREWRDHVTWGGDADESIADPRSRDGRSPSSRRSLAADSQAVVGRSRPWRASQVEAVTELGRVLAEHTVAALRDQLAHVALHDPLTGLANRTLLMETLQQILAGRPHGESEYVGLLFLDVDNFKLINDSLGHRAGDALLQQLASRITAALRKGDIIARLGGDEFVVVLQGITTRDALGAAIERIEDQLETTFDLDGSESAVTVSIGIASTQLPQDRSPSDLLRDADTAMYEAKRRGRGRAVTFHPSLDESRRRRVERERHLQGALERDELRLEYQPIFSATGEIEGLEALVRWAGPGSALVGPSEFIPIAEELGIIEEIGGWVMEVAFTRLAQLREAGADEITMAVNLSARELADPTLAGRVTDLLERLRIPPDRVCLEITERLLVSAGGAAEQALASLRAMGVQVAIDDFGTGFSSLAHLRRLPADVLKIDRSFIAELGKEQADTDIVGSVIDLARRLNIRTVAEGVETDDQLRILRELACDRLQGFRLARPLSVEQLAEMLIGS
ncbi:MAG: EAL domain-containing protein [Solirubrobacterales bacterium]|nr:EAL domain-containing protein [Solirubrobacterales bacterium]